MLYGTNSIVSACLLHLDTLNNLYSDFADNKQITVTVRELQSKLATILAESYHKLQATEANELTNAENSMLFGCRNKIGTIKLVRERTGMGLKEAKDLVWDLLRKEGYDPDNWPPRDAPGIEGAL